MNITKKMNGSTLEIALEGRLDTMTAPQLEAELASLDGAESLVLDCRGGMKITHINEIVSEVLEVTGFTDILTIE